MTLPLLIQHPLKKEKEGIGEKHACRELLGDMKTIFQDGMECSNRNDNILRTGCNSQLLSNRQAHRKESHCVV